MTPEWGLQQASIPKLPLEGCVLIERAVFGAKARARQRDQSHAAAAQRAMQDIERAIRGRPLETLSEDEFEKIGLEMLLHSNGLPHPFGSIRYEIYTSFLLRNAWTETNQWPKLKRRYLPALEEPALFSPVAVGATERLALAARSIFGAPETASVSAAIVATRVSRLVRGHSRAAVPCRRQAGNCGRTSRRKLPAAAIPRRGLP